MTSYRHPANCRSRQDLPRQPCDLCADGIEANHLEPFPPGDNLDLNHRTRAAPLAAIELPSAAAFRIELRSAFRANDCVAGAAGSPASLIFGFDQCRAFAQVVFPSFGEMENANGRSIRGRPFHFRMRPRARRSDTYFSEQRFWRQ